MRNAFIPTLLMMVVVAIAACGPAVTAAPPDTPTPTLDPVSPELTMRLTEFRSSPDTIRLRVGQHITLHVVNGGATDHEIMIGRNPLRDDFGKLGAGFEHDFFALTHPTVEGDATVMGMEEGDMSGMSMQSTAEPMDSMDIGDEPSGEGEHDGEMMNGFMAMFEPQQEATITFDVTEDMLGTWTIGCFEESEGIVHFDEGMAGILTVLPAQ